MSESVTVTTPHPSPSPLQVDPNLSSNNAAIVILGATGDLTSRKLMPALFELFLKKCLAKPFVIVGFARRDKGDEGFRQDMHTALEQCNDQKERIDDFLKHVFYHQSHFGDADGYSRLGKRLDQLERDFSLSGHRIYYLATAPEYFEPILEQLDSAALLRDSHDPSHTRVVIEKPFGHDLASARELNGKVSAVLKEPQVYRIDHYLGKETVQNILSFRFGNSIFEPLFTQKYVDHIQITVAEDIGMEGRRGQYYDTAGTIRDMLQNHVLQLLCLVAMEPPTALGADEIRDEKVKVLRSIAPMGMAEIERNVVRGQYGPGEIDGRPVPGYRQEEGVDPASNTETFIALRLAIDNWRWAGVPFLLRSGKCLPRRVSEIAVQFKQPPLRLFQHVECEGDICEISDAKPNVLTFHIQPDEGISMSFSCKRPGMQIQLQSVQMDFQYGEAFGTRSPEAYERLLLDALRGDSTLFTRRDEVESAWELVTPILNAWQELPAPAFPNYGPGSWGPPAANQLFRRCVGTWRTP